MNREEELLNLIKEQKRDDRYGSRVKLEEFIAFSMDSSLSDNGDSGTLGDFFDENGTRLGHTDRMNFKQACPMHGLRYLTQQPAGRIACTGCNRIQRTAQRRARGMMPRGKGPQCGHDPINFMARPDGGLRCHKCESNYNKKRKDRKRGH